MTPRYLSVEQQLDFRIRQRRMLKAMAAILIYSATVALVGNLVPLDKYGFWIVIAFFVVGIYGLYCMFRYYCPVCKKHPRVRVWSFGGAEVAYGSMVALFPKTCSECGVHLQIAEKNPSNSEAKHEG